jgi:hypothetical protein
MQEIMPPCPTILFLGELYTVLLKVLSTVIIWKEALIPLLNDRSTIGLQVAACCDKEHDESRVYSEWQGNSPLAGTVVA